MVVGGVPILGKFLEDDAIVLHALLELVRARAHRLAARILVEAGGRHHHAGAVRQLRQQRGVGLRQVQHDGVLVGRVDAGHGGKLALAVAVGQRAGAIQVGLDRGGVDRRAVMEDRVGAQLERQGFIVGADRPGLCQLRHELQIGRDIHQLVA
ncbi:hypothetical protein D3C86_1523470 [compost metagenome]